VTIKELILLQFYFFETAGLEISASSVWDLQACTTMPGLLQY
jgi:hypothetical protein